MEGWPGCVDLGGWLHNETVYLKSTRCRVTSLIKTNALTLCHVAAQCSMWQAGASDRLEAYGSQ